MKKGDVVYWGGQLKDGNLIKGVSLGSDCVKWDGNPHSMWMENRIMSVHTNSLDAFLDVLKRNPKYGV